MSIYVTSYVIIIVIVFCFTYCSKVTIHTKGCTIPAFPIINENTKDIFNFPVLEHNCSHFEALVDYNKSHLWVVENLFPLYNIQITHETDFFCCYRNFATNNFSENIIYGDCVQFSTMMKADHEFVRIECYYRDDKIYDDFFVFTKVHKETFENKRELLDLNVIILGIESMSRINFLRTMPETAKFLKKRGSIQLLGYNKLGDNSLPNLVPLLTGKSLEDFKVCYDNNAFDTKLCSFLWDDYKNAGFRTALGSDSKAGLLGSYEIKIGKKPPDYYLQPFMYETRKLFKNKDYDYHLCVKKKFYYKILLDYISNLSEKEKDSKLFGMFWEESVSHERINYPKIIDDDYVKFLKKIESFGYLNKTVLIFLSDHGMRWGDFVQTEQGRYEERLPLLEVLFPPKFKHFFKKAFNFFKHNSNRLTTPYDVYYTLSDLLNLTSLESSEIMKRLKTQNPTKTSLFLPVPGTRTCLISGIGDHWCTCRRGTSLQKGDKIKTLVARKLVTHINNLIVKYPLCHKLEIKKVLEVSKILDLRGITYKAMIETSPGGAVFDGTLRMERGLWAVSGSVSRYNLYRGQSDCVEDGDINIKMYCFCK